MFDDTLTTTPLQIRIAHYYICLVQSAVQHIQWNMFALTLNPKVVRYAMMICFTVYRCVAAKSRRRVHLASKSWKRVVRLSDLSALEYSRGFLSAPAPHLNNYTTPAKACRSRGALFLCSFTRTTSCSVQCYVDMIFALHFIFSWALL